MNFNKTQLYISWQAPIYLGVPPVSTYIPTVTSSLDPTNRIITVNTTSVLFTQLLPGLSYDITVVAVSTYGSVSAPGPSSDRVTFSTVPTGKNFYCWSLIDNFLPIVPTLECNSLIAVGEGVNVSWTVGYNGGRDISAVEVECTLAGSDQKHQPINALVTPTATSVLVRKQFVATRSYTFQISAKNSIGRSDAIVCGPVLITEGL